MELNTKPDITSSDALPGFVIKKSRQLQLLSAGLPRTSIMPVAASTAPGVSAMPMLLN